MNIDGTAIAAEIRGTVRQALATLDAPLRVIVFALSEDDVTRQFIGIKEKAGRDVGIDVVIERLPVETTTAELIQDIEDASETFQGMIVQLPLPAHVDLEAVRDALPKTHDVDCLGSAAYDDFAAGTGIIMPPVVAAMKEMLRHHGITIVGKRVVIIGRGRLVGLPAAAWFEQQGANVDVCDERTNDIAAHTKNADIIVLGAGSPALLTPDMINDGVVIFDAGASESSGKVVGDADPACAEKATLFTPVPGGIGPVAVAMLFSNLYTLATDKA